MAERAQPVLQSSLLNAGCIVQIRFALSTEHQLRIARAAQQWRSLSCPPTGRAHSRPRRQQLDRRGRQKRLLLLEVALSALLCPACRY